MEQVNKFLSMAANVILFCMAVSVLMLGSSYVNTSIRLLKTSVFRQNVIREQEVEDTSLRSSMLTATRGEIIGVLLGDMETILVVDGTVYTKDNFTPEGFDYTVIRAGVYLKEYINENGYITEIVFTHMEE